MNASEVSELERAVEDCLRLMEQSFHIMKGSSGLFIERIPPYACWPIVVPPSVAIPEIIEACRERFNVWAAYDLRPETVRDVLDRPKGWYVAWVKGAHEAEEELRDLSAAQVAKREVNGITLRERLLLELYYHSVSGKHLNMKSFTLCTGSRRNDGEVPRVDWSELYGELVINAVRENDSQPKMTARTVVC